MIPSIYAFDGLSKMRVVPRLTIDKILMLSVLLSFVYLLLYGSISPENMSSVRQTVASKRRGIQPGPAFTSTTEQGDDIQTTRNTDFSMTENMLDFPVQRPPSTPVIKFPEIIGFPAKSRVQTCTRNVRLQHLRESCKTSPAREYEYDQGDKQALRYAVVDHDRKLFYCLIGKAGSKSWLQYMVDSKSNKKGHLRHNEFLETVGLEMLRNLPLEKVEKDYKDYFKFLVVRHPLQRTVSAFYETVVLHKKYRNERGALLNFTEFAERVTDDLMDANPHWRRYINRCKVCKVDYEYVIKTETMDEDIQDFNKVVGERKDRAVDFTHQNQFLDGEETDKEVHHYKYDKTLSSLQRKHPTLMKKLINVYAEDMQLFGYKWDWKRGKSSCVIQRQGDECC